MVPTHNCQQTEVQLLYCTLEGVGLLAGSLEMSCKLQARRRFLVPRVPRGPSAAHTLAGAEGATFLKSRRCIKSHASGLEPLNGDGCSWPAESGMPNHIRPADSTMALTQHHHHTHGVVRPCVLSCMCSPHASSVCLHRCLLLLRRWLLLLLSVVASCTVGYSGHAATATPMHDY